MIGGQQVLQASMLNDTGLDGLTLFAHEAQVLGYDPSVHVSRPVIMDTANGLVQKVLIVSY